jgi:hypothetical protein
MYTINELIFGLPFSSQGAWKLDDDPKGLALEELDGVTDFLYSPYHGGSRYAPVMLGIKISDDDNNENWLAEVRGAKAEDWIEKYNKAKDEFLQVALEHRAEVDQDTEYEYRQESLDSLDALIKFIQEGQPDFYLMESSS